MVLCSGEMGQKNSYAYEMEMLLFRLLDAFVSKPCRKRISFKNNETFLFARKAFAMKKKNKTIKGNKIMKTLESDILEGNVAVRHLEQRYLFSWKEEKCF